MYDLNGKTALVTGAGEASALDQFDPPTNCPGRK